MSRLSCHVLVLCVCVAASAGCMATATPAPDSGDGLLTPEVPQSAQEPEPTEEASEVFRTVLRKMGVDYRLESARLVLSGWVNMTEGLVEVFACAPDGKTHEAVVVLDCVPSAVHAGLLALGLEPGTPVEHGTDADYRMPSGPGVIVEVQWTDDQGKQRTARAEDWIRDETTGFSMPHVQWLFTGSFLQSLSGDSEDGTYAANYVKSLVTTYHDPSTILENPLPAGADDTLFYANGEVLPPRGTPVRVVLRPVRASAGDEKQ